MMGYAVFYDCFEQLLHWADVMLGTLLIIIFLKTY